MWRGVAWQHVGPIVKQSTNVSGQPIGPIFKWYHDPWRWSRYAVPKRRYPSTNLRSITSRKCENNCTTEEAQPSGFLSDRSFDPLGDHHLVMDSAVPLGRSNYITGLAGNWTKLHVREILEVGIRRNLFMIVYSCGPRLAYWRCRTFRFYKPASWLINWDTVSRRQRGGRRVVPLKGKK